MTTFAVPKSIRSGKKEKIRGFPPDGSNIKIEIMYAIVDIAGQQFKVEKDKNLFVHRLAAAEGSSVEFDKVLLIENEGSIGRWNANRRRRKSNR
jgi:hypothetical protein